MEFLGSFNLLALIIGGWLFIELIRKMWVSVKLRNLIGAPLLSEYIIEAGVTGKMAPRMGRYITEGSTVYIVGNDGRYTEKKRGKFWIKTIESWLESGASITYILTDADEVSRKKFEAIAKAYPDNHFRYCELADVSEADEDISKLIKKYYEYHPTLIETSKGDRAMWLEGYHPEDSEYAYDINFITPAKANSDDRFDKIKGDLEKLIDCKSSYIYPRTQKQAA